jgi:hypothetical protein
MMTVPANLKRDWGTRCQGPRRSQCQALNFTFQPSTQQHVATANVPRSTRLDFKADDRSIQRPDCL